MSRGIFVVSSVCFKGFSEWVKQCTQSPSWTSSAIGSWSEGACIRNRLCQLLPYGTDLILPLRSLATIFLFQDQQAWTPGMICYNLLKVLKFPTHVLSKRYPWVRECSSCFHYIPFIIVKSKFDYNRTDLIIPPLHRRWNGGILDSPRCLPVRLKTTRFPELF